MNFTRFPERPQRRLSNDLFVPFLLVASLFFSSATINPLLSQYTLNEAVLAESVQDTLPFDYINPGITFSIGDSPVAWAELTEATGNFRMWFLITDLDGRIFHSYPTGEQSGENDTLRFFTTMPVLEEEGQYTVRFMLRSDDSPSYRILKIVRFEAGCICPEEDAPVCGVDGMTYPNACEAACAGIAIDTTNACDPCADCPDTYEPVCGADGNTYDNACLAECAGVEVLSAGECACTCADIDAPVCGEDGQIYKNACEAACAEVAWTTEGCGLNTSPSDEANGDALSCIVWEDIGWIDGRAVDSGTVINTGDVNVSLGWYTESNGGAFHPDFGQDFVSFDNDVLGAEEGYLSLGFDNAEEDPDDKIIVQLDFDQPVEDLSFQLLDIDGLTNTEGAETQFDDGVEIFINGEINVKSLEGVVTVVTESQGTVIRDNEYYIDGYEGYNFDAPNYSEEGNLAFNFGNIKVNSLTIKYFSTDDLNSASLGNPAKQQVGMSDICFRATSNIAYRDDCLVWEKLGYSDEEALETSAVQELEFTSVHIKWQAVIDSNEVVPAFGDDFISYDADTLAQEGGYLSMGFNNNYEDVSDYLEVTITFPDPVEMLRFTILDIDSDSEGELVESQFDDGVEVLFNGNNYLSDYPDFYEYGGLSSTLREDNEDYMTGFEGNDYEADDASTDGNLNIDFQEELINNITIRFRSTDDLFFKASDPMAQLIGISDLCFRIPFEENQEEEIPQDSTVTDSTTAFQAYNSMNSSINEASTFTGNDDQIRVFPNPTSGTFNLSLKNLSDEQISIQVIDLNGKIILERQEQVYYQNLISLELPLDTAPGIYLIQVTPQGKQPQTIKLLKNN